MTLMTGSGLGKRLEHHGRTTNTIMKILSLAYL